MNTGDKENLQDNLSDPRQAIENGLTRDPKIARQLVEKNVTFYKNQLTSIENSSGAPYRSSYSLSQQYVKELTRGQEALDKGNLGIAKYLSQEAESAIDFCTFRPPKPELITDADNRRLNDRKNAAINLLLTAAECLKTPDEKK